MLTVEECFTMVCWDFLSTWQTNHCMCHCKLVTLPHLLSDLLRTCRWFTCEQAIRTWIMYLHLLSRDLGQNRDFYIEHIMSMLQPLQRRVRMYRIFKSQWGFYCDLKMQYIFASVLHLSNEKLVSLNVENSLKSLKLGALSQYSYI